jgi:CRISPR/Cas system-associated exonuclease Cas4 (RecB family)
MKTTWSYSGLITFEQCPALYQLRQTQKSEGPPSYAMLRGLRVHQLAEQYLKGGVTGHPRELSKFSKEFQNLKRKEALPEESIAFDNNWQLTSWMDESVWLRMKLDARVDNWICDYKTGSHRPEHEQQMQLYADSIFAIHGFDEITTELWYLGSGEVFTYEYTIDGLAERLDKWKQRADAMLTATAFEPVKGKICDWCEYKAGCKLWQ